ncbi:MAG: hypothetical protein ACHQVS_04670 [Candidatus Babeliales bacterium]
MKKLFIVMGLVIGSPLYLNASFFKTLFALEEIDHFASGKFEQEWNAHGYPYTPQQVEAFVEHLVAAVSRPEYVKGVMSLMNDIEAGKGESADANNIVLPLKYLTYEDVTMLHHFFYSIKQIILLKNSEYLLTVQLKECAANNIQPDATIVESLDRVRQDIAILSQGTIMGLLAVVAGYHAMGMLTPAALKYSDESFAYFNLKWFPLMFAMRRLNHGSECDFTGLIVPLEKDKGLTEEEAVRMVLIGLMQDAARRIGRSPVSHEEYQKIAVMNKSLEEILAAIDDHRNQSIGYN